MIQPLDRIEALVGPSPHYLFVDAVQAFGKMDLEFAARAPDMMAVSAHKIGGPAGVGALLMKGHADQVRLIPGGGQETGRRGGTEAAALIAGFGAAAEAFPKKFYEANVSELIRTAEEGMRNMAPDLVVFGEKAERIGNVSNFAVPGLKNAVAMMGLDLKGHFGLLGVGLLVGQGRAEPCAEGHGRCAGTRRVRHAPERGLEFDRSGYRGVPRRV